MTHCSCSFLDICAWISRAQCCAGYTVLFSICKFYALAPYCKHSICLRTCNIILSVRIFFLCCCSGPKPIFFLLFFLLFIIYSCCSKNASTDKNSFHDSDGSASHGNKVSHSTQDDMTDGYKDEQSSGIGLCATNLTAVVLSVIVEDAVGG